MGGLLTEVCGQCAKRRRVFVVQHAEPVAGGGFVFGCAVAGGSQPLERGGEGGVVDVVAAGGILPQLPGEVDDQAGADAVADPGVFAGVLVFHDADQGRGVEHGADGGEPAAVLVGRAEVDEDGVGAVGQQDVGGPGFPVLEEAREGGVAAGADAGEGFEQVDAGGVAADAGAEADDEGLPPHEAGLDGEEEGDDEGDDGETGEAREGDDEAGRAGRGFLSAEAGGGEDGGGGVEGVAE